MGAQRTPRGRLLPGTAIEVLNEGVERGRIRHALFDFDGTLSLIRQGWQQVMIPMMVDILAQTPRAEERETMERVVTEFVERLTGKQTIYQMIQLCEEIRARGGTPADPLEYKRQYHELLWEKIKGRVEGLKRGTISQEQMLVPGSKEILAELRARGVKLYLASGTDRAFVIDEARALGIAQFFGEHIYGALDDYRRFSKAMLIGQIIEENNLSGPELVAFGDGYVEIENAKQAGGIAVGVASDEVRRAGINEWKRQRLIGAGADIIIPDFREARRLVAYLFAEEGC